MNQRTVLVTGASGGIGSAIASRLSSQGFALVVHYRSGEGRAKQVVRNISEAGGTSRLLQFDIGDREQTKQAIEADINSHGAYYGVVCNAGISADNAFPALTGTQWDRVIHTNLDGFYNVLHPTIMPMTRLRQGGRIVTLSSVSGVIGNRGQTNYSAAKAGIIGATKALALELAKRNITVNCVAPGLIETGMTENIDLEHVMQLIPLRRLGRPEEVAETVAFLFSDMSAYITRQVISIDGGIS